MEKQCDTNEVLALKKAFKSWGKSKENTDFNTSLQDNVINIQISYDLYQPTESNLWDGSFISISLYSSLEHLSSNTKNIKKSLN